MDSNSSSSRRELEAVVVATAPAAEEEEGEATLPGFRFHPTDEELVGFYLRRKVERKPIRIDQIIKQVDIYKYDPWDLPRVSNVGDKEWYFFCPRGRKYRNSVRPNRVTGSGFWKATGIDRPIYAAGGNHDCVVGLKKSLVYYRGSAGKGVKTDWMMHEFRLPTAADGGGGDGTLRQESGETWTICRIFKRHVSYKIRQTQAQSWRSSDSTPPPTKQAPSRGRGMQISSQACSTAAGSEYSISDVDDDGAEYSRRRRRQVPPANHSGLIFQHQVVSDTTSVDVTGAVHEAAAAGQLTHAAAEHQLRGNSSSSSRTQSASPVSYGSCITVQTVNDFLLRDGISWEELGRMAAEFAGDPLPGAAVYDCGY